MRVFRSPAVRSTLGVLLISVATAYFIALGVQGLLSLWKVHIALERGAIVPRPTPAAPTAPPRPK